MELFFDREDDAGADVRSFYTESLRELLCGTKINDYCLKAIVQDFEKRNRGKAVVWFIDS